MMPGLAILSRGAGQIELELAVIKIAVVPAAAAPR